MATEPVISNQQKVTDGIITNALDILRVTASEKALIMLKLQAMAKKLVKQLNAESLEDLSQAQVEHLIKKAGQTISQSYTEIASSTDMSALAEAVSTDMANTLQVVLGQKFSTVSQSYLDSVASNVLIQGSPAEDWWNGQSADTAFKFAGQVRQGLLNGETNQQIITRIVGNNEVPGVMATARNNAASLVHTAVQAVASDARRNTFQVNSDVIDGIKQVSTLDSHTSLTCIAYSGAEWDLDYKPINGTELPYNGGVPRHFNCRSVEVPLTKSFRDLGIDIDEPVLTTRASSSGQVAAKTTFDDYLKRMGQAFQDEVLGEGRADLWRDGKITLRDLVGGDGSPLTLAQLRAKAGL